MILALQIVVVVLAALLSAAILLQSRGTGLGAVFGGEGNIYRTKRGLEKILFRFTIAGAVLFFTASFLAFYLAR